jgi:calcineurin-like phosphoesterase family protein
VFVVISGLPQTLIRYFGHTNIIKYCDRPFSNVEEMDEALIYNWNKCVSDTDTIYHLGDFAFRSAQTYLDRLNGYIRFVRGNHEKPLLNILDLRDIPYMRIIKPEKTTITLSHCCMRVWDKSHFDHWHLYGHSHGTLPPIGKSMDVGVDCNNYSPVSLDYIKEYMGTRPHNPNWIDFIPGYDQEKLDKAKNEEDE